MTSRRSTWLRALTWSGGSVVALTGFIGLLHVPALRGALARTGITWGCPVPKASPAEVEAAFAGATRAKLGTKATTLRPAAGFALGTLTADGAVAQLAQHGVRCSVKDRGFHMLRCEDVPAAALGETGRTPAIVTLVFDRTQTLLSVDVWRSGLSETDGAQLFHERDASIHATLGEPSTQRGTSLALPLSSTSTEYAYSNYLAKLSATNIPGKGIAVREQFTDTSRM